VRRIIKSLELIVDGKPFHSNAIFSSKELTKIVGNFTIHLPLSLLDEVEKENGKIVLVVNDGKFNAIDLKEVSPQLYDQFYRKYILGSP
jgi:16S rRNA C1402 (ribose-2'-O) methylase RsmI